MSDSTLKSFKIAEKQKPKVNAPAKTAKTEVEATPESGTLGFARIEALLDEESPEQVSQNMAALLEKIVALEADAKGAKAKSGIKRAKLAVERTVDLLDYLFKTKASMQQAVESRIELNSSKK